MSFAPDESASQIFAEKTVLQGTVLNAVFYGAQVVLYGICMYHLWNRTQKDSTRRMDRLLMLFSTIIVILGTLNLASDAAFTQAAFITDRNYPGGPAQYETDFFYVPIDTLGNVSFILSSWACDGLMLWRFWVIYRSCRYPTWLVLLFPILLYLASWTMGVLFLTQLSVTSPWGNSSLNWTIPYFSLSLSFNMILTIGIVWRLFYLRRTIASAFQTQNRDGAHDTGSQYTNLAAMTIESSAALCAFSILCVVPFARGSAVFNLFSQPLGQVQIAATLLIIYRVAIGSGWVPNTYAVLLHDSRDAEDGLSAPDGLTFALSQRKASQASDDGSK